MPSQLQYTAGYAAAAVTPTLPQQSTPTFSKADIYDEILLRNVKSGKEVACISPFFVSMPEKVEVGIYGTLKEKNFSVDPMNYAVLRCYYDDHDAKKKHVNPEEKTIKIYCKGINAWGDDFSEGIGKQKNKVDSLAPNDLPSVTMSRMSFKLMRACVNTMIRKRGMESEIFRPNFISPDLWSEGFFPSKFTL